MAKWADYCVSKLSLTEGGRIDNVMLYEDMGESLGEEVEKKRDWMVKQVGDGKTFCSIKKNDIGKWNKIGDFGYDYDGDIFTWFIVPGNITKRKTFVSYYHQDNQDDRTKFENLFDDLIVSKSVEKDDIDSDNSDEYIKQLIQQEYLHDTTVLVVLIGSKTKCRKHVDWEISGALNFKVGETYAGLLGLILPTHDDYGKEKATYDLLPARLSDNLKTGYAIIRDWTDDRALMQSYIEQAFTNRTSKSEERTNSRIQMDKNTCE